MKLEKWTGLLKKYRYAALIVLAGVVLMLLPTGGSKADSGGDSSETAESFSLEETEKRMAEVLDALFMGQGRRKKVEESETGRGYDKGQA